MPFNEAMLKNFIRITKYNMKVCAISCAFYGFFKSLTTMDYGNETVKYDFLTFVATNTMVGVFNTTVGGIIGVGMGATWFMSYPMAISSMIAYKMK
jgi:hypothetical protein